MPETDARDPLRLEKCPACGYALEGLAPEGVCPECGVAYDQSEVVLHGYGAGRNFDVATARPRAALALGVAYAVVVAWSIRSFVRSGLRDAGELLWPALLAVMLAWSIWKRSTTNMPGLVQVRLSSRGAVQVNNPVAGREKAGKLTPWREIGEVRIRPAGPETVRIRLVKRKTFWRGAQVVVEADVRSDERQARALVERVERWQTAVAAQATARSANPDDQLEGGRQ